MNNKKLYELKIVAIFTIPTIICLLGIGWMLSVDTNDHEFDKGASNLMEQIEHEHKMNKQKIKGYTDKLECTTTSLKEYGFKGKNSELVCYDESDYTDFVIIDNSNYKINDNLVIYLDDKNNIIDHHKN